MSIWNQIPHKKNSGKEYSICPSCSHTRKKKTDKCMSSDHDTGHYSCSHCGVNGWKPDGKDKTVNIMEEEEIEKVYIRPTFKNKTELPKNVLDWFLKRGIKQDTLIHFKTSYGSENMPKQGKWVESKTIQHNYFKDGVLINTKFKTPSKEFKMVKDAEKIVFNMDSIKESTELLFCEGEEEVMVWHQSGYKHAISVANGAVLGKNNLDYVRKYWKSHFENKTKVYIAVDNDEPGNSLKEDLIRLFGKDICYVVEYPKLEYGDKLTKDANDILLVKGEEYLMNLLTNAKGFDIDGVFTVDDVREEMLRQFSDTNAFDKGTSCYKKGFEEHWSWRKGEVNVLFGPGNQGKSCWYNELAVLKAMNDGTRFAMFSPEQTPPIDFYNDIIHTYIGKSTDPNFKHLQMSMEEYEKGLEFARQHFIYVYPKDYHDKKTIFGIFKAVLVKHDVEAIAFDPLNQLDRIGGDEKLRDDQFINAFGKELKRFITMHNLYSMVITHGDAKFDLNSGLMLKPNMYRDIEGGKMWSKIADNIMFYYRPNFQVDIKDPYCVIGTQKIKKQKLVGKPGQVDYSYDKKTNRYTDFSGIDDFTGETSEVHKQQQVNLTFPEESFGNARPTGDEDFKDIDETPF